MKDDSLNDTQPHECVGKQKYHPVSALYTNVYERQIWNEAIEAAALEMAGDRLSQQIIRRLKK